MREGHRGERKSRRALFKTVLVEWRRGARASTPRSVNDKYRKRYSDEDAQPRRLETLTVSRLVALITHKGYSGSVISVIAKKPTGFPGEMHST